MGMAGGPSEPSAHRLFVYFVPQAVYAASFATEPYFHATAEQIAKGDIFYGVTGALYIRASASNAVLRDALLDVLNLVRMRLTRLLTRSSGTGAPSARRRPGAIPMTTTYASWRS